MSETELRAALIEARCAINSMKAEAEAAGAGGDEQMLQDACETISNEGPAASMAIDAALAAAPVQPAIPPDSRELELAAPAQDARKPLTDAQIDAATLEVIGIFALDIETNQTARMIARTIEAAHSIT